MPTAPAAALVRAVVSQTALTVGTLVASVGALLVLLRATPGDATDLVAADAALQARLATAWDLDAPLHLAVGRALSGAWGTSWTVRPGASVAGLVGDAVAVSAPTWTIALALCVGASVGLAAGPGRLRRVLGSVSVAPVFLLGWAVVLGLNAAVYSAKGAGWIDRPGWFPLPSEASVFRDTLAVIVLAVGSGQLAAAAEQLHDRLEAIRRSQAVEVWRLRGLSARPVIAAMMLPHVLGVTSDRALALLGALVVLERVFAQQGLGSLLWEGCIQRDQPVVLACGVVAAAVVAGVTWAASLGRAVADPRLRGST